LLSLLLVAVMMLSLAACGDTKKKNNDDDEEEEESVSDTEKNDEEEESDAEKKDETSEEPTVPADENDTCEICGKEGVKVTKIEIEGESGYACADCEEMIEALSELADALGSEDDPEEPIPEEPTEDTMYSTIVFEGSLEVEGLEVAFEIAFDEDGTYEMTATDVATGESNVTTGVYEEQDDKIVIDGGEAELVADESGNFILRDSQYEVEMTLTDIR